MDEDEPRLEREGYEGNGSNRSRVSRYIREWQASSSALKALRLHVILPESRWHHWWTTFILVSAAYSSFFTPMEFGFFRGLPWRVGVFDMVVQVIFLADIVINFFVAYKDSHTYKTITDHKKIALRYGKTDLIPDFLACLPWDALYKACGRHEEIRYMLWIRLYRVRKVERFFKRLEKDIRVHYFVARIAKLLTVELYCTHTAACIFYYLATTMAHSQESYTWIGSLTLGDFSYHNFHEIDLLKRYVTALYWAILTMATVGYGDIHAVNVREMVFVMIFVSFDMILGAYLIGNMTGLIVRGSSTEKFRDRMAGIIKFMNMHSLPRDLRQQMKAHVRLEFEGQLAERTVMKEFPASIRAKVSQALYLDTVADVPLFKSCSNEFINQIVSNVHKEYFLPGEIIMEQGSAADRLYIVSHGLLEVVSVAEDASEEVFTVEDHNIFGEVAVLCNIPQPYTVRVSELSALLRLDKHVLTNIMQIYAVDSRQVLNNLLKQQTGDFRISQLTDEIQSQLGHQQSELTLRMNNAAFQGDLYYLRSLIRTGADPVKSDYIGKTPLHLAASKGYDDIVSLLLREGADVNALDNIGNSPLLEAIKGGHDYTASILVERGARLNLTYPGNMLIRAVVKNNLELLKRLINHGVDPNAADYYSRTALHVAAAEGLNSFVKFLINAGANIFYKDRWGRTPYDEAKRCGSVLVISAFEAAAEQQTKTRTAPSQCSPNIVEVSESQQESPRSSLRHRNLSSREVALLSSSSRNLLRTKNQQQQQDLLSQSSPDHLELEVHSSQPIETSTVFLHDHPSTSSSHL
ncbi:potassium channel KOR2-like [Selaginella moellendorffii]|uniref:potassium channel KOR2-like n=1 Tax=Selaginella moellendorffii TaxID=88036 RepID=UPI000D1C57BE|nr:potassium channel KOR2-like [Selaginella moellendorffii]|eukprot:XP_024521068.1 potassium channel KOR2-like [Selaginella moellendorffii]